MKKNINLAIYFTFFFLCILCTKTFAIEDIFETTFLSAFPKNGVYDIAVIGDDFAQDLHEGLQETFKNNKNLEIRQKHFPLKGFFKPNGEEKIDSLEVYLKQETPNIVFIMMGSSDRNSARDSTGKRLSLGSLEWTNEYKKRVDTVLKIFKKNRISVYVIGLPAFRNTEANEFIKKTNDIFREISYLNGMKFIDTYAGFLDDSGSYTQWGPDINGKIIKLRDGDGQRFTYVGNLMLSHFIERELHRDITEAQAIKIEPLAGGELEQNKINPDKPLIKSADKESSNYSLFDPSQGLNHKSIVGEDISADNQRVSFKIINKFGREEETFVDLLRPPLSSSVISLIEQRENKKKQEIISEKIITRIDDGLIALNTIILPATDESQGVFKRTSQSQTTFYKLIIKGERLSPKEGRADDQQWPISE